MIIYKLYPTFLSLFSGKKILPYLGVERIILQKELSQHEHFLEAVVYLSVLSY